MPRLEDGDPIVVEQYLPKVQPRGGCRPLGLGEAVIVRVGGARALGARVISVRGRCRRVANVAAIPVAVVIIVVRAVVAVDAGTTGGTTGSVGRRNNGRVGPAAAARRRRVAVPATGTAAETSGLGPGALRHAGLEYLETLVRDAEITELDLWSERNNIDDLQSKLLSLEGPRRPVGDILKIQRAQLRHVWKPLEECMLDCWLVNSMRTGVGAL